MIQNYSKSLLTICKIVIPIVCVVSLAMNMKQCSDKNSLSEKLNSKDNLISQLDELKNRYITEDSSYVHEYIVHNNPKISKQLLTKKIDSLSKIIDLPIKPDLSKGGYYSKTKFTLYLVDVKATFENDSIAEYNNHENWYASFNKKQSTFNVNYTGEHQVYTTYKNGIKFGNIEFKEPELISYNWLKDSEAKIISSETIFVPTEVKENKFKLYTNTEYRQSFDVENKQLNIGVSPSLYQGVGINLKSNRNSFGLEYNFKLLGEDYLPKQEIKLKYNFYIVK